MALVGNAVKCRLLPVPKSGIKASEDVMGKSTSFSLGNHFVDFIEEQVAEGRYGNASDVVRAGLRLLEEQEAKLAALRSELIDGEASGPTEQLDFESFIVRKVGAATRANFDLDRTSAISLRTSSNRAIEPRARAAARALRAVPFGFRAAETTVFAPIT
jgi:antitoxin ParD1/3/4